MRSDSGEYNFFGFRFTLDFVDQQKITANMTLAIICVLAIQCTVLPLGAQRFA